MFKIQNLKCDFFYYLMQIRPEILEFQQIKQHINAVQDQYIRTIYKSCDWPTFCMTKVEENIRIA